jgi:peptidoglycan/LPS O-acetylase OafA/YrhL
MKKFHAIEGLRGWLAWTVVLAHLAYSSGIYIGGIGQALGRCAYLAVLIFVIVSGFVITHLVVERPEPYGVYLVRRFMRIFPIFAVTCVLGYFAYDLEADTLFRVSYAAEPAFNYGPSVAEIADSDHRFLWSHAIAHLVMLHGAISNGLLPFSEEAFNAPAWSLSLEWQFYLIAPFVVLLVQRHKGLLQTALVLCLAEVAMRKGLFGEFTYPSFLPAAAGYFAVGIASRLAYSRIPDVARDPRIFLSLGLVLLPLVGDECKPIVVWILVVLGLERPRAASADLFSRGFGRALESRPAQFIGSRSYSTYLCHMPIIAICHRVWLVIAPHATSHATFLALLLMTVPLTLLFSELLYRCVERPGIALGSMLADSIRSRSPASVPVSRRA